MKGIKNIIFDFGGIFLNLSFKAMETAFKQAGITNFNDMFTQHHASDLFEKLETGHITPEAFYEQFRIETGVNISNDTIRDCWNAILLGYPPERLAWLSDISKRYHIYLYSNTNKIHYDHFTEIYRQQFGEGSFNDFFIKAYYSHELGLRKPYPASYTHILQEQGLIAAETLFIDDTYKNIEGAQAAGLQTIHLPPPQTVLDLAL